MNLRGVFLLLIASLFVATGSGIAWLLYSNSGAQWLWVRAVHATGDALGTASLDGTIRSGLVFGEVYYRSGDLDVSADSVHVTPDFQLFPFAVDVRQARLSGVRVTLAASDATPPPQHDTTAVLQHLGLPFSLRFSDLSAQSLTIETPGFARQVQQLELRGTWHETIDIESLRVASDGIEIDLEADIDPARDLAHVGRVQVRLAPDVTGHHEPLSIALVSEGSHRELALRLDVANFDASVSGELRHLFDAPEWDVEIVLPQYRWSWADGEVDIRQLFVRSTGHPGAYEVRGDANLEYPGIGPASVAIEGAGTTADFAASSVRIRGDGLAADGSARVVWAGERQLSADFAVAAFDPAPFVDGWPAGQPVRGRIRAMLDDDRLEVTDSTLEVPGTGAQLLVNASFDRAAGDVAGALRWRNLRWPIAGDDFVVKSDAADVIVAGSLDGWTIAGRLDVGTPDMPEGSFEIQGGGTREGAFATVLDAAMLGGSLAGDVAFSWQGAKAWRAALTFDAIETGTIVPGWPGRLSGGVAANGTGRPRMVRARLDDVTGVLRGADLRASGGLAFENGALSADRFAVSHGDSSLQVHGSPRADSGLNFDAVVVGARQYLPEMAGSFTARGVARLTQEEPFLSLDLKSDVLEYRDVQFTGLAIDDAREAGQIMSIRLSAEELRAAGRTLSDVDLRATVAEDRQTVEAGIAFRGSRLTLSLDGAMDDWRAPAATHWRGVLDKFEFALDDEHAVSLTDAAPLVLSLGSVDLGGACLSGSGDSSLCVETHWEQTGAFAAKAALRNVPVGLLEHLTDLRLEFDQVLNGAVEWAYRPETGPSGAGNLLVKAGRVASVDDPALELVTGDGSMEFEIERNRLLSGALVLPLPGTGEIYGSFVVEDIGRAADSPVKGELHLDIAEIAILAQLLPQIDAASGRLVSNALVSGTVSAPLLTGDLRIEDGSIEYLPIGLRLRNVELEGRLEENYRAALRGRFRAGDGSGEIEAQAEYADLGHPRLQVDVRGENILLVDVPDVRLTITPAVRFGLEPELLTINGALLVPMASVKPVNLSTSRVYESQDVEIVAGELPDPVVPDKGNGLRYGGSLGVALGDDIVIDLDLARARVTGLTRFDWKGDAMPFAHGRYDIAGTISAFGQVLDISEGSVRFPGVRADNPLVRIHAEREIYGNTQIKRAGVLVDGPLKRPSLEAYTQPLTTEERALTLLVTGSDFDYEQGVGAIDFGTYIAPRLFMSYGVGVFERENIISARFDLSKSLGIKASSGSKESGIDLNYRFEN